MLFNKLTCHLVFAVLLVAGLAFVATPATAQLLVEDADTAVTAPGIQVSGYAGQPVAFELKVRFPEGEVTGFGAEVGDIKLIPTRSGLDNNNAPIDYIVPNGATAGTVTTADSITYTATITVKSNVDKVQIEVPEGAATTPGTLVGGRPQNQNPTVALANNRSI